MRSLSVAAETFALTRPFRIARGTRTEQQVVSVAITQDGVTGRGECTPYARYDEDVPRTIAAIEAVRAALTAGVDRTELEALLPAGAARNALDCALWDLAAKLGGTSVARIAGLPRAGRIATAITVVIDIPDIMAAEAAKLARAPLLKVKVDAEDPLARLRAVRAAAPEPRLIVDPNESWSVELLVALQDELAELRVDLLEQPVPAAESEQLHGLARRVPIAADEAVHTAADVAGLVGRYDVANIKLDKTGGLTEALRLAEAARKAGLGVMVGCMLGSSLAMAPALLVAQGADFADLDGPYLFREDRPGGMRFSDGLIVPPTRGFWGD
jgi:L-alanine-DL-glutamate epimerase-like enolase superfamily enzyme